MSYSSLKNAVKSEQSASAYDSRQCLSGTDRMFSEHMVSEYSIRTEGRGRVVDEWAMRPGRTENHFWDCLVGCAVAASEQGITLTGYGNQSNVRKPAIKLSSIRKGKSR